MQVCIRMCLVAQSRLTLCHPMDCSPPGINGDSPGKNTGMGYHALLQGISPTQGLNPGLPHCRRILYHLSHQGSPYTYMYIYVYMLVTQSCLTLGDRMDCSSPGSSVHGILLAIPTNQKPGLWEFGKLFWMWSWHSSTRILYVWFLNLF